MIELLFAIALALAPIRITRYAEGAAQPVVTVDAGYIDSYTAVQDDVTRVWRATYTAVLDPCAGVLTVNGVEQVRQRCIYLPQVSR